MQKWFIYAISNFIQIAINYNLLIVRKRSLSDNGNIFLFGGGYETQHFHLTISKIFVILNEIVYYFVKVLTLNRRQLCSQLYHKLTQKLDKGWKLRILQIGYSKHFPNELDLNFNLLVGYRLVLESIVLVFPKNGEEVAMLILLLIYIEHRFSTISPCICLWW